METISSHSRKKPCIRFKSYYVVWKLVQPYFEIFHRRCLNRTMQYGNIFSNQKILRTKKSLNRTMQYGNHFLPGFHLGHSFWFKSYYVVWKPAFSSFFIFGEFQFKSYYVVWKPLVCEGCFTTRYTFKSYYVVWKLLNMGRIIPIAVGLNRTMQYGNFIPRKMMSGKYQV